MFMRKSRVAEATLVALHGVTSSAVGYSNAWSGAIGSSVQFATKRAAGAVDTGHKTGPKGQRKTHAPAPNVRTAGVRGLRTARFFGAAPATTGHVR